MCLYVRTLPVCMCACARLFADSNRGPSAYQPNALPLGQTGSHDSELVTVELFYSVLLNSPPKWCTYSVTDFVVTWLVPRETAVVSALVLCTPHSHAPVFSVS